MYTDSEPCAQRQAVPLPSCSHGGRWGEAKGTMAAGCWAVLGLKTSQTASPPLCWAHHLIIGRKKLGWNIEGCRGSLEWWGENLFRRPTRVAVVQPDTMSVVLAVTLHGVVAKITLCHFLVGVYNNLSRINNNKQGGEENQSWHNYL